MSHRRRVSVTLLLVLACAFVGVLAGPAASCGDGCGIECGACVYCPATVVLSLEQPLQPPLDLVALARVAPPPTPTAPLPRAIEHVPLGVIA